MISGSKHIILEPNPARTAESLRDTGYDFNPAIADLIDNSIAAEASTVDVYFNFDVESNVVIEVVDDGSGMSREGLINAMQYGSRRRDNPASLGKFGMGLKTSSTAFSRRFSVTSRDDRRSPAFTAVWDLDHIVATNSWALEIREASANETKWLDRTAKGGPGTIVRWDKVDRVLTKFKDRRGKHIRNARDKMVQSLEEHLALVFQRFLDHGDDRAPNLTLCINGNSVQPWDPFCLAETGGPEVSKRVMIETPIGCSELILDTYLLPRKEDFQSEENLRDSRLGSGTKWQGVYVYRENRLIHGPDWLGMWTPEVHYSLMRVDMSFQHPLDDAFMVDIKKSRIRLDESLAETMNKELNPLRREADNRHRRGGSSLAASQGHLLHSRSDAVINRRADDLRVAHTEILDEDSGQVRVHNKTGTDVIKFRVVQTEPDHHPRITTSDSLREGILWELAFANGVQGITLNTSHDFYRKAYLPNKYNSSVIQALDYLFWAFGQAELNLTSLNYQRMFEELHREVSYNLRQLVTDLPDPVDTE